MWNTTPPGALRPYTYATLIALLSATGLRISEALALRFCDVSSESLLIRKTKFRKSRLVPLHETVVLGLERYFKRRHVFGTDHDYVFITDDGQPLAYGAVHRTFQKLLRTAKLWPAPGANRPRLHDLRYPNLNKIQTFITTNRYLRVLKKKGLDFLW